MTRKQALRRFIGGILLFITATYGMWLFPSDTAKNVAAVINFFLAIPIAVLTALDVARSVESDPEVPLLHEFSELRVIVGWICIGIAAVITGWALFNIFVQERPGPHLFRAAIPGSLFLIALFWLAPRGERTVKANADMPVPTDSEGGALTEPTPQGKKAV